MTNARDIKAFLREKGIDTQHIRITNNSAINVKLLDAKLDYEKIDNLLKEEYESFQRDSGTGEILSGGNTFVFVEYDNEVVREVSHRIDGTIHSFLENCNGSWHLQALVNHYVETRPLEDCDPGLLKRAVRESLYTFLTENKGKIKGLTIDGWN